MMNPSPKISVAMPVYNGEKYLGEAIESILNQTFSDFEFIIIDDGSTDNSLSILRDYEKRDARILLVSRENRNVAATLNEIASLARGEWFARMDQDDLSAPERFATQLKWLEKTGADICGAWVKRFGTYDQRIVRTSVLDDDIKLNMLFTCPLVHPSVIMRTEVVRRIQYDETGWEAEDYDFWERSAELGLHFTSCPEMLLRYRVHPSQISSSSSRRQNELTMKVQSRYWNFLLPKFEVPPKIIDEIVGARWRPDQLHNIVIFNATLVDLWSNHFPTKAKNMAVHAKRIYFFIAPYHDEAYKAWILLNTSLGLKAKKIDIAIIWLIGFWKINLRSRIIHWLRVFYIKFMNNS